MRRERSLGPEAEKIVNEAGEDAGGAGAAGRAGQPGYSGLLLPSLLSSPCSWRMFKGSQARSWQGCGAGVALVMEAPMVRALLLFSPCQGHGQALPPKQSLPPSTVTAAGIPPLVC